MASDDFPPAARGAIRRKLLAWFAANARSLPWRLSRDPYRIWVSEVMLQQTTVAAVVPYFHRFLERFPTVIDLAEADLQDVLKLWEGLGYYRRARNLHRAAQDIVAHHAGTFPTDIADVRALPGLGRYTTNAVLSQAFDQRLPILEANSTRVLCRLLGIRGDAKSSGVQKVLWKSAESLVPEHDAGQFNQALMELGALVCTPRSPICDACPLRAQCRAYCENAQEEMPARAVRPEVEEVREVAVVIWKDDRVLLVQRPTTGRWADLWEFPHEVVTTDATHVAIAGHMLATLGIDAKLRAELLTIRHGVTRFRIELRCLDAEYVTGSFRPSFYVSARWLSVQELAHVPVSRPQRRLAQHLAKDGHRSFANSEHPKSE